MLKTEILDNISEKLQLLDMISDQDKYQQKFEILEQHIDYLINCDFNKLLSILYRVDVSEEKLRKALAENKSKIPAARIIALLMIERENEKIEFRAKYSKK